MITTVLASAHKQAGKRNSDGAAVLWGGVDVGHRIVFLRQRRVKGDYRRPRLSDRRIDLLPTEKGREVMPKRLRRKMLGGVM